MGSRMGRSHRSHKGSGTRHSRGGSSMTAEKIASPHRGGRPQVIRKFRSHDRVALAGFNPPGQSLKGSSDGFFGVILPYPFLQRRRKRQRLARFETEGTNEAKRRLRHVGGLYLERGIAHARIEPSETHGAIV